jgi:hypothetical protein
VAHRNFSEKKAILMGGKPAKKQFVADGVETESRPTPEGPFLWSCETSWCPILPLMHNVMLGATCHPFHLLYNEQWRESFNSVLEGEKSYLENIRRIRDIKSLPLPKTKKKRPRDDVVKSASTKTRLLHAKALFARVAHT